MKKLSFFFVFLLCGVKVFSQSPFLIEEEFNGAPTAPSGWTFSGSISTYTSTAFYGKSSPSLKFQSAGDQATTTTWSNGDQITFWMRSPTTPSATDLMQVEVYDGALWTTIANVQPHTTSTITTLSISTAVTKARFTYAKSGTNVALDDVTVRQAGNCTGSLFRLSFINIDACGASCEGRDEFFTFTTGSDSLDPSNIEFNYPDAGSYSSSWCGTGSGPCDNYLLTSSSTVSSLNTTAGCTFLLSPSGKIPPNANVIIFNGNPQNTQTNFSSLCSSGVQYYAVFANNTADCNGRFSNYNASSTDPYRAFFIRDRTTGCTDTNYYYANNSSLNNGDGTSASYTNGSGPSYVQTSCTFVVLPIELLSFEASLKKNGVELLWSTASEINNDFFTIERSADSKNFEAIAKVNGAGNSTVVKYYEYIDDASPFTFGAQNLQPATSLVIYYRLKQTDYDGRSAYSRTVAIDLSKQQTKGLKLFPNPSTDWVYLSLHSESNSYSHSTEKSFSLHVFNMEGREVLQPQIIRFAGSMIQPFDASALPKGVYIFQLNDDETIQRTSLIKE